MDCRAEVLQKKVPLDELSSKVSAEKGVLLKEQKEPLKSPGEERRRRVSRRPETPGQD